MKPGFSAIANLPEGLWQACDLVLHRFEEDRKAGNACALDGYACQVPSELRQLLLVELIHLDMEFRCQNGQPLRIEYYLEKYPDLSQNRQVVWALLLGEIQHARAGPLPPPLELYQERFPAFSPELHALLADIPAVRADRAETLPAKEIVLAAETGSFPRPKPAHSVPSSPPGYEILEELGRGGMGVVYKARELALKRLVALKMILGGESADPDQLVRFQREAEAAAKLQHPNIVQIHHIGEHESRPFFSLEFVEGGSLARKLQGTPLLPQEAAILVEILARAMQVAHRSGIVHRDLKPANILLSSDGTPKITDFGLAKRLEEDQGHTQTGAILGTPSYMAPEQAEGKTQALGPLVDVYALGAVLYEFLTGRPPFRGASVLETLEQVRSTEPVPPTRLQPKVPRDLETICLKCLEKLPTRRYSQSGELAADLRRFLDGEPIQARPASWIERGVKWAKRRPSTALLMAMALFFIIGTAAGSFWYINRQTALKVEALIQSLESAETAEVSRLVAELREYQPWAHPLLAQELAQTSLSPKKRLHVCLVLAEWEDTQVEYLTTALLKAKADDFPVIRDALGHYQASVTPPLWDTLQNSTIDLDQRFRAACALASFDSNNPKWDRFGDTIAGKLVLEPPLFFAKWTQILRPVRRVLVKPLVQLVQNADVNQYGLLQALLQAYREEAVAHLEEALVSNLNAEWKDSPASTAWDSPDPALVKELEAAQGLWTPHFALCQTLPLHRFVDVVERLRSTGFRPACFRPYVVEGTVLVAANMYRDGREWQIAHGKSAADLLKLDAHWQSKGYQAADITGYSNRTDAANMSEQYAALWVRHSPDDPTETKLFAGITSKTLPKEVHDWLLRDHFVPVTQAPFEHDGNIHYCALWRNYKQLPRRVVETLEQTKGFYEAKAPPQHLQIDVRLRRGPQVLSTTASDTRKRFTLRQVSAEKRLKTAPGDIKALLDRAIANWHLGNDQEALTDLSVLYKKLGTKESSVLAYSALIHARVGNKNVALEHLRLHNAIHPETSYKSYLCAVVAAHFGEDSDCQHELESAIASCNGDPSFLYTAARAYSLAFQAAKNRKALSADKYSERAVMLLNQAVKNGFSAFFNLQQEPDFDPIRDHQGFMALVSKGGVSNQFYAGIWQASNEVESTECHGLDPERHLAKCMRFSSEGFRPVAISVCQGSGRDSLVAASVWHRPAITEAAMAAWAKRKAQAAVALLQLGHAEPVWPLFRHQSDPGLRTALSNQFCLLGVSPTVLLQRLKTEPDPSARRAFILCLGSYLEKTVDYQVRESLAEELLDSYRNDPDPGIHSALDWLLRRWGRGAKIARIDGELASQSSWGKRLWRVNKQGITLSLIPGPVESHAGLAPYEAEGDGRAQPQHRIHIRHSFSIATKEITVSQFRRFWRTESSVSAYEALYSPDPEGPINAVTWFDAAKYCRWLSEQEGIPEDQMCFPPIPEIKLGMKMPSSYLTRTGYRLPTELEWEHACRAGATTNYHFGSGSELLGQFAWHLENSRSRAWQVGQLKPNDLGLFDMHGNIMEWCLGPGLPSDSSLRGRIVWDREESNEIQDTNLRPVRGGAFNCLVEEVNSSNRELRPPSLRTGSFGFRIARTIR
jgi:formylglycine-generating enzyme required for sulfatase activity